MIDTSKYIVCSKKKRTDPFWIEITGKRYAIKIRRLEHFYKKNNDFLKNTYFWKIVKNNSYRYGMQQCVKGRSNIFGKCGTEVKDRKIGTWVLKPSKAKTLTLI